MSVTELVDDQGQTLYWHVGMNTWLTADECAELISDPKAVALALGYDVDGNDD